METRSMTRVSTSAEGRPGAGRAASGVECAGASASARRVRSSVVFRLAIGAEYTG